MARVKRKQSKNRQTLPRRTWGHGRKSYHHGNVPEAIIEAAVEIIEEKGIAGLTMLEAARRIGVSPETPRRHFTTGIPGLLIAIAKQGFRGLAASFAALEKERSLGAQTPETARRYLVALGIAYIEYARSHPAYFRVMFSPEVDVGSIELDGELSATFGRLVAAVKSLSPPQDAEANFVVFAWTIVHGMSTLINDRVLEHMNLISNTSIDGLGHILNAIVNSQDFWSNLSGPAIATLRTATGKPAVTKKTPPRRGRSPI